MANLEADYGAPVGARPRATPDAFRSARGAEIAPTQARPASNPKFCRVDAGQLIRALIIVILSFGVVQLSHAEKADDEGNSDLSAARRM